MASGPDHYRQAEMILRERYNCRAEDNPCKFCVLAIAEAQVHATLAMAAAMAIDWPLDAWKQALQ